MKILKIFILLFLVTNFSELKSDEVNDNGFDEESSKIKASSIISNISEFSNTQNKVNAADLSSKGNFLLLIIFLRFSLFLRNFFTSLILFKFL